MDWEADAWEEIMVSVHQGGRKGKYDEKGRNTDIGLNKIPLVSSQGSEKGVQHVGDD